MLDDILTYKSLETCGDSLFTNIISFVYRYRSYERFLKNISICRQTHYLTQRFSLTGRPCVQIR